MRDTLNIGGYYNNEDSHCGLMGYNILYSGNWLELVPDSSNIQNRSHNMKIIYIYKKKLCVVWEPKYVLSALQKSPNAAGHWSQ